jgi:hypothetical protein
LLSNKYMEEMLFHYWYPDLASKLQVMASLAPKLEHQTEGGVASADTAQCGAGGSASVWLPRACAGEGASPSLRHQ